ncbi:MAG: hypothetical protein KA319_13135 [Ferruginibacter sp.]|nr:hypothetical protein [Ferruginibacter sp.]
MKIVSLLNKIFFKSFFALFILFFTFLGCSKKSDNINTETPPTLVISPSTTITIPYNTSATFSWTTNGVSITVNGVANSSGTFTTPLLQSNTTYTVIAYSPNYSTNGLSTTIQVNVNVSPAPPIDVYIVGSIDNNAVIWKNGTPTFLTNYASNSSKYAAAMKVKVYNNDLYIAGYDTDTIKVWKNGIATNFPDRQGSAVVNGMDIYNNDVYVCGTDVVSGSTVAKIWKNGVFALLTKDTFNFAGSTEVRVINGDVYVCGSAEKYPLPGPKKAVYWKNGTLNILPTITNLAIAIDVFSINNDLFFTGADADALNSQGVIWKNGIRTTLPFPNNNNGSFGYSIFVENNDVYVGGTIQNNTGSTSTNLSNGVFWKNNTLTNLTNSNTPGYKGYMTEIFVKNSIVYSIGRIFIGSGTSSYNQPLYFKNSVAETLTGFTNTQNVELNSIFVK